MSTTSERFEPTLAGLPVKLKERIIAHLDDISLYEDDEDWEDDKASEADEGTAVVVKAETQDGETLEVDALELLEDPEDQRVAALSALSLVNKEWYSLVAPVIWRELCLFPCSTESLLELVVEILPCQGKHVDQISFEERPISPLLEDGATDELPSPEGRALEVVEAAERLASLDVAPEWEIRVVRARTALLAQVVKSCPNVKALDIEGPLRPITVKTGDEEETLVAFSETEVPYLALEAVKSLGGAVEALSLLLPPDGISTEGDAATLLSSFPNLKSLEINCFTANGDEEAKKADRAALYTALSSLTKLEELDLGASNFVIDEFAALPLAFPLTHLALNEYNTLSFPSFITLVERFSATLESLELDGTPHDEDDEATAAHIGKPLNLPKLVELEFATEHKAAFLDLFAKLPLKTVSIGECPEITAADVLKFLEAHKATLKQVALEPNGLKEEESDGEKLAIEVVGDWCEAQGISFAMMLPNAVEAFSDSEDEDEEDGEEA
ncbi:hypothetical protein JCM10213_006120 [Rhodosporidiobolus nylandii]